MDSEATTKNHPPDIDIIMFQISARQGERNLQPPELHPGRKPERHRSLFQFDGNGAQRLVETEGHVPGLAGEDREYGGEFSAQDPAGCQGHEEHDRDRDESQDRDRLQDIEQRDQQLLRTLALGRPRRVGQCKYQRQRQRGEHPERGASRVLRQVNGIKRQRRGVQLRERHEEAAAHFTEEDNQAEDNDQRHRIPARGQFPCKGERFELAGH